MERMGKGDTPRPMSVTRQTYEKNWDNTFKPEMDAPPEGEARSEFLKSLRRVLPNLK